ncbi:PREDICTED: uncharacterized transcriptional regulatory protein TBS1-like isoform X5 [Acromyrmex echinatior]|uniref:uncharacterized transcriptional regulatory protein TBS1-like isoform X5 n=1 Tax=Acromyrmex echinatior TaxID=103372 RepID=UPI000580DB43|nr:PREDICTED: uncharacterized transcriptional regulatory protein TBS1-like isoform X5 [Acromyrmex echinatior]
MRALYMLLILTVIGDVFERTIVDAKPYEVERDSNPSSGRNLKNSLLNNIEENHYNIKHNYDDYYKICRRCNNYANDNDDDDDDDISTTDNPIDSDDSDDIDIIDDIDDIVDIDDFLTELIKMFVDHLLDFIRNLLCELPLINFICGDIYIK